MAGPWHRPNLAAARRIGLLTGGIIGGVLLSGLAGVRLNPTPSIPVGLYLITSAADAPLVEFCPSAGGGQLSRSRGYRACGPCPDGAAPLVKPVVGREGDLIDFSARGIAVNGRLLPNTAARLRDTAGRPLPHWPFGQYQVAHGTAWMASSHNPLSFDSRYFGPVEIRAIQHRLRPLWTFGN